MPRPRISFRTRAFVIFASLSVLLNCFRQSSRCLVEISNGVSEHADSFNLDLDGIAAFHEHLRIADEAYSGRGSRRNDITDLERHDLRYERDQVGNFEDEVSGVRLLHRLSVQTQ